MKRYFSPRRTIFGALAFVLAGCSAGGLAGASAEPTVPAAPQISSALVSATGIIVPEQYASLSVSTAGVVAEVPVNEGDFVKEGELLVQIKGGEQARAAVAAAEFELANARVSLDGLFENTNILAANALKTAEDTEDMLEDILDSDLQEALALQAVADAQKAVEDAERGYNYATSSADQEDIDVQNAQVLLAKEALDRAIDNFEPYEDKPESNLTRANLLARKAAAQQVYDAAVRQLNALLGTSDPVDIAVSQANLATAQAQLATAERNRTRVQAGPSAGDIALLEAQIANAYRDYEIYKDGPDPDDVRLLEARIANAEAQLAAAQAALDNLQLLAPFDGIVSVLNINQNEWVAPGQPVLVLADLNRLQVETTDLGEIDVARIRVGFPVMISFDAFPDLQLSGVITSIAPKANLGAGVNYTVVVSLDELPPELRWGMTAFVDIDLEN